ncbi:MAG: sensor histidine kinase [Candidatus Izemoplasmataceae bacterium]
MKRFLNQNGLFLMYVTLAYGLILSYLRPQEPAVFFLWLASVILLSLRLRLGKTIDYLWVDLLIILGFSFYQVELILLALPILALYLYERKFYALVILLPIALLLKTFDLALISLFIYNLTTPVILSYIAISEQHYTKTIDLLRQKQYTLEQEKEALMDSQNELSRISILSERNRIAHKLHDDLGHELTASLLALRAYETVHESAQTDERFIALKTRIKNAVTSLKETVEQTRPEEHFGFERLKALIDNVTNPKVSFTHEGNLLQLSEIHYYMLTSVLKEALTNVIKHATPKTIEVVLTVKSPIVKLTVKNDGINPSNHKQGSGLIFMRKKVESLNGHLTIQKDYYFTLHCILPLTIEREGF